MTTKDASIKFKIDQNKITKLCQMGLIPRKYKYKGKWIIPDELDFILDYKIIKHILLQIIILKNNINAAFSKENLSDLEATKKNLDYLVEIGFIHYFDNNKEDTISVLCSCILTNEGLSQVLSNDCKIANNINLNVNLNLNNQLGLINMR